MSEAERLPVYATGPGFGAATNTGRSQLAPSSPGAGVGRPILNSSDGYTGRVPDVGAHQRGAPPMRCGVGAGQLLLRRHAMKTSIAVIVALLGSQVACAESGILRFDMGPEESPVWPGFELVTAGDEYSPERGRGWVSRGEIRDFKNYQPDDLARDLVVVKRGHPLEFRLKLANGDYRVWVLSGDDMTAGEDWYRSFHLMQLVRILAEGKEVFRQQRDYYGLQDTDYVPGQSIWDKYIKDRYLEAVFPVSVADGELNLVFEGLTGKIKDYPFPVNAVLVYPAARADEMAREIARITELRKDAFSRRWTRKPRKTETPPLDVDEETKRLGYLVFPRNYLKLVFPDTTPEPREYGDTIRTYASQGEWEPVSFCIRPVRELNGVSVAVSELRSGTSRIPAENIRLSVVKYQEKTSGSGLTYMVVPYSLMHWWKEIDIPAGLTKQYWLKIRVPESAEPGFYDGTITIAAEDAGSKTLRLRLRVLPFRLMRSEHASWFYFGTRRRIYHDMNDYREDEEYREIYKKESENLKEHGFCIAPVVDLRMFRVNVDEQTHRVVDVDFSRLDREMEFRKEIGAMPPDGLITVLAGSIARYHCGAQWVQQRIPVVKKYVEFSDKKEDVDLFVDIVRRVDEHIRQQGWGTPVFECGGELTNYGEQGTTYGMRAYGALKKAGVLTALRGNGPSDLAVIEAGLIDYAIPNIALIRDAWTDTMKRKCKGLWLYNFSNGRYGMGFFAWKKGASRRLHEGCICTGGRPWDDFDAGAHNWHVGVEGTRDGVVSRISFEHMAEGRDDFDYLYTCEQLIRRARNRGSEAAKRAAAEAAETLEFIADRTFTDFDYRGDIAEASGIDRDAGCRWPADDFQKARWLVARQIMKLHDALE